MKIISRDSTVKAFVKINESAAGAVIDALHGKTLSCGRIKVFLSHKQFISYEKPLAEVIKSHSSSEVQQSKSERAGYLCVRDKSGRGVNYFGGKRQAPDDSEQQTHEPVDRRNANSGVKNVNENAKNFDRNDTKSSGEKAPSNGTTQRLSDFRHSETANEAVRGDEDALAQQLSAFCVSVTHDDPKFMERGKVSKIFRKIGRVVHITHDLGGYRTVAYRSENEMLRALNAMASDHFFGYKLYGTNLHHREYAHCHSLPMMQESARETHVSRRMSAQLTSDSSVVPTTLRLTATGNASIELICRAISRISTPTEIVQAQDHLTGKYFYLVSFSHCYEAAEVLVCWQKCNSENILLDVKFEQTHN